MYSSGEMDLLKREAISDINISPLVERLENLIRMFGGNASAFDMEWKIRLFVIEILNYALIQSPTYERYHSFPCKTKRPNKSSLTK